MKWCELKDTGCSTIAAHPNTSQCVNCELPACDNCARIHNGDRYCSSCFSLEKQKEQKEQAILDNSQARIEHAKKFIKDNPNAQQEYADKRFDLYEIKKKWDIKRKQERALYIVYRNKFNEVLKLANELNQEDDMEEFWPTPFDPIPSKV